MQPHLYPRRSLLAAGTALAATTLMRPAWAQSPAGMRKLFVGFPAGGTADSLGRALAQQLADASGGYVVENKTGASGQLAADAVRLAAPDGTALLLTPSSVMTLVPQLYRKPMYDTQRDFVPVACVCDHSFALAVNGNSPHTSLASFMAWARANPSAATYATPGPGSGPHFLGTMAGRELGAPWVHVPYRGVVPGLQDLMGGQVACTFNPLPTMLEYHRAGRIRILAVTSPQRLASLPEVPTFAEAGHPGLQLVEWYGLFASAKVPAATVGRLGGEVHRAMAAPEMQAAARRLEVVPRYEDGLVLARLVQQDQERWRGLVTSTGIQLE
ncbi:tripartite-type tricarboxylate transporter receptor subunit TctC [Acidovorax soli]|uniref:Tripartite-type tricarboxylate transporter receptor subunit TctC n=1 Tax=Acidovorax soli TaxID=592050 RepID=A0A7X0PI08_9BURK|nr:tripartite tricarboxylate transporter substrate-binding protein [Acidovorax soli]MBB6561964.1 tripartite-type tricarboxylate transporter receptor subunit TctC [Acidovorax soli]